MVHVSRGRLLLVGVLSRDVPALLVVELLHRVLHAAHLGQKQDAGHTSGTPSVRCWWALLRF